MQKVLTQTSLKLTLWVAAMATWEAVMVKWEVATVIWEVVMVAAMATWVGGIPAAMVGMVLIIWAGAGKLARVESRPLVPVSRGPNPLRAKA